MEGKPGGRDRQDAIEKKPGLLERGIQHLIDVIANGQRSPISRTRSKTGFMGNGLVAGTGKEVNEMVSRVGAEPTTR